MARPRYFDARSASFRAIAPAVDGFHGLAFLQDGSEGENAIGSSDRPNACAPRSATTSWHLRVVTGGLETVQWTVSARNGRSPKGTVRGDRADLHVSGNLAEQIGQHRRVADLASDDFDGPDLRRLFVHTEVDLAPLAPFRAAMLAGVPFVRETVPRTVFCSSSPL